MHNVPREEWRSSVIGMCFCIFLSLFALPVSPRLSWQGLWVVTQCPKLPLSSGTHRADKWYSQGGHGHRATRDGATTPVCSAQHKPRELLGLCSPGRANPWPSTVSGRSHVNKTTPVIFVLAMKELLASTGTHGKLNRDCPVWQPKCENLGTSSKHSSRIKGLNITYSVGMCSFRTTQLQRRFKMFFG